MSTEIKLFTVTMNTAYRQKSYLIQGLTWSNLRIPKRHRDNYKLAETGGVSVGIVHFL